ncbi:MAG: HNH endonuclease, partial [Rhodococcus sp. (in: high G+C Gram-positive bacteria)]|nr:HNH endonuclease [Rhodococcus sp. (in: high G+C Gram-positive bacteria)]
RTPAEAGMRLLWEPKAPRRIEKVQQKIWSELSRT